MKVGTCRSCQKQIIMARHIGTGKPAPIEVQPSEDGNILVTGNTYEVINENDRQRVRDGGFVLRKNHFATCQFAKKFARRIAARRKARAVAGGSA